MNKKALPYADKSLGQHFLKDANIIEKICQDYIEDAKAIIEVGPGPAILSEQLSKLSLPYAVIEMDTRFEEYLTQWIGPEQITFGDALQIDLSEWTIEKKLGDKGLWLVSNLPYNVGVPIFLRFLRFQSVEFMTLMFQKEVGEKIVPAAKKKNPMSSLMALGQTYFHCKALCHAAPTAFQPPPKVDSIVISLQRKEQPEISLDLFKDFERFLRNLFQFKRKQVAKTLKAKYPADRVLVALEASKLDTTARAETFNLEQVQLLYKNLHSK